MLKIIGWRIMIFSAIFLPVLNVGLGKFSDLLLLLCVVMIFLNLFRPTNKQIALPFEVKYLIYILLLASFYGLISGIFFSTEFGSWQAGARPLRALVMFYGIYFIVQNYSISLGETFSTNILYDIFLVISAHAVLMILEFIFPELRDIIYPYTFADQVDSYNQMFRMAGITMGGGALLSVFQSIGLLLWPIVYNKNARIATKVSNNILAICIFLSMILCGRSGFIVLIVFFPIIIISSIANSNKIGMYFIKIGISLCAFLIILSLLRILLVTFDFSNEENWAYAETAFTRAFDYFSSDNSISNHDGLNELSGYWFLPNDASLIIFGNPYFFETSYNMGDRIINTDVGYINFLFGYGFIGSSIQYSFYAFILYCSIKYRRYDRNLSLISVIFTIIVFIFHGKETVIFSRIGLSLTTIFFTALLIKKNAIKARIMERSLK